MGKKKNISKQRAAITWIQFIGAILIASQAVFWLTSIYKDVEYEALKTETNTANIEAAKEQTKRRIKNSEEKIKLEQKIKHQEIEFKFNLALKDVEIKSIKNELKLYKNK